jgi:hypothetical protein
MKVRMRYVQPRDSVYSGNEQVRAEIQCYLEALASYPERFAEDPDITFKKHLFSLVEPVSRSPRQRNQ